MALAERADLIVDFTNVPVGNYVLANVGPDEPFGGGESGRGLRRGRPRDDRPDHAVPGRAGGRRRPTRRRRSSCSCRPHAAASGDGHPAAGAARGRCRACFDDAPAEALLGTVSRRSGTVAPGSGPSAMWMDPVTENPAVGATEVWEIYNTTADAHPMHIHEVAFEVVNRQDISS